MYIYLHIGNVSIPEQYFQMLAIIHLTGLRCLIPIE